MIFQLCSNVPNCDLQQFTLSYVGMAAAIGQSIDIPILIRALACDIYRFARPTDMWTFTREFKLALDAGIDPDDPTSPVESYLFEWWRGESAPAEDEMLCTTTLLDCLFYH